ncbi:MAG: N-acyl homoserine lactonase family protein [Burkholderiales bacterium]
MLEPYEVYAIRYGHHERRSSENFIGGDPHDTPMPLDYYVWAVVGSKRTYIVDSGFNQAMAQKRGREITRPVADGLGALAIDPARVADLIVTHLHYDHAGNLDLFPAARLHIQDAEVDFATGRCMCHDTLRHGFEAEDVCTLVRRVYGGSVQFHDGDQELAPGLSLHRIGGHTKGLQVVRVWTQRGWVVLASDATHFYRNMREGRPFPIVYNVADMLDGHRRLLALADSPDHIVPGHDPLVGTRYPPAKKALEGIVRLDLEPRG